MLTPDERELIQQLLDDVMILEAHFALGIPRPAVMRTCFAPILRRWIAEKGFFRAQKLILPTHVTFTFMSGAQGVEKCRAGLYESWMGMTFFGTLGVSMAFRKDPAAPEPADATNLQPSTHTVKEFFEQPMFFWRGRFYSRADVIKMHANKLGGVHLDFRRADDEAHINEIKTYFGFEIKAPGFAMLVKDQIEQGRQDPARRQVVYDATELIALDTARIFAGGIRASEAVFRSRLI